MKLIDNHFPRAGQRYFCYLGVIISDRQNYAVDPKSDDWKTKRDARLVVCNKLRATYHSPYSLLSAK